MSELPSWKAKFKGLKDYDGYCEESGHDPRRDLAYKGNFLPEATYYIINFKG
jgi:ribosomal protein S6